MEAKKRTRRHLSAQAWREVFGRFDGSSESVSSFCKREGLHTSSFRRWQQRLAEVETAPATMQVKDARDVPRQAPVASFIEMGPMATPSAAAARLEVKLELGGGLVLHVVRG
jgi:putative transposase